MDRITQFIDQFGPQLLRLAIAVGLLIAFWIAALIASAIVRGLLKRTLIDEKIVKFMGLDAASVDTAGWGGKIVYYLILLFGLIAFFGRLGIPEVSAPITNLLNEVFVYLPRLGSAVGLMVLAFVLAWVVRKLVTTALGAAKLDERLGAAAAEAPDRQSVATSIGNRPPRGGSEAFEDAFPGKPGGAVDRR